MSEERTPTNQSALEDGAGTVKVETTETEYGTETAEEDVGESEDIEDVIMSLTAVNIQLKGEFTNICRGLLTQLAHGQLEVDNLAENGRA